MFSSPLFGSASLILFSLLAFLTLAEYSIVSSRRSRLKEWASRGDRGAESALRLSEEPEQFLATVRIGTLASGVLAGLLGGVGLVEPVAQLLARIPALGQATEIVGHGLIVATLAFALYVCGEIIPRQIALSRPEWVAARVARPMRALSWLASPLEHFWGTTVQFLLRAVGIQPADEPPVTEEEIKVLLEEGTKAGVFEEAEQQLIERVFRYCDRRAKALMTPRDQIVWIEIADPPEEIRRKVMQSPHSRFPVCDQSLDNLLGVVEAKHLIASSVVGEPLRIRGALNIPTFLYEGTRGLKILETFRKSTTPVAIVLDEYGSVVGLLTLNDILQAFVGDLSDRAEDEILEAKHRTRGARVLDGRMPLDEFTAMFDIPEVLREDCDTLAGFVVTRIGHIPKIGENFTWNGLRFEVIRMVGNRVHKVAVIAAPAEDDEGR